MNDSSAALCRRMRAAATCCLSLAFLLSAGIATTGRSDAGASNLSSVRVVPAEEEGGYPRPSNYKGFVYHALIIGVDIVPVNGSGSTCHEPFAAKLAAFLKRWRCFSKGSIIMLKGSEGTKKKIKSIMANLHLGSRDVLIVYYGGHGDLKGIVGSDLQHLSPPELSRYAQQTGAGFKVLLVSACSSGIFVRPREKGRYFQRAGFAVVSDGEEGATSTYASEGIGFGPYLWKLLNLKQKDPHGVMTLGEFINFVRQENYFWRKRGDYRLNNGRHFGPKDSVIFWN